MRPELELLEWKGEKDVRNRVEKEQTELVGAAVAREESKRAS